MADSFDVIVIGAGPGGYVAAIRAAQLGMSVACVDKRDAPGGTCLNIGCIPSKALLQSSEKYEEAGHALAVHGVKIAGVSLDLKAMLARKDKVVLDNTNGVQFLFRKNKVEYVKGCDIMGTGRNEIEQARRAAKNAEVAIVVVGESAVENNATDGEGYDVASLDLTGSQEELVEAVAATGTPTIVVLVNGRPLSTRHLRPAPAPTI